ncbi:hypothetical protein D3H55_13915 [Bacillus salacetis]|uniref:Uncharacterized protein n=1 Tax=Bacillus salacetis TaxID=2315464 RepID=A0A3A1QXV2_9BACI|nr:hypothetical protein [Bacillus salacetis]RIW31976.1 hypothetical protein D3H55_13915 [Bacillus salacetis]
MNSSALKDVKLIFGFLTSLLCSAAGILLAVHDNGFWIAFIVMAFLFSFLSVRRAEKNYSK